jgi:hypothetical protein
LKDSPYFKQAELMLKTIPHVAAETCFALKGGTAINLFVRDMPRLSADIELTYLPVDKPRQSFLNLSTSRDCGKYLLACSIFWRRANLPCGRFSPH